jgi:hypothetical protein
MSRIFIACKAKVLDRRVPPDSFLNKLIDWVKKAPDEVFEKNDKTDIYSSVAPELGLWISLLHRKAVMLEVLRVLGGFESSWNWSEGRDITNPRKATTNLLSSIVLDCFDLPLTITDLSNERKSILG